MDFANGTINFLTLNPHFTTTNPYFFSLIGHSSVTFGHFFERLRFETETSAKIY
jgi:hypothetical protein